MRETLPKDRARPAPPPPPEAMAGFAALAGRVMARSQIVWGEHCSECAYPACYASCAFYTPRSDLHCRRFEAGIEPVGHRGLDLTRIRFRKWGKLEGRGPAPLRPLAEAARMDGLETLAEAVLNPLPFALERNLAWRWSRKKAAMLGKPTGLEPDALVIEAMAADGRRHPFTVSLMAEGHGGEMFQARFEAGPAYGRLVVPIAEIRSRINIDQPYLIQIEPIGEAESRQVIFGLCDFARFDGAVPESVGQAAAAAPKAKVVVWDLDETLWTGTLAEDGAEGVSLRPDAVAAIKALDARGVVQSVASKNDDAEAMRALERFGLADYFLHPQIHWSPKSGSVAEIARRLDLGLDSVVFIDDQPFERGEVQAALPAVRVLPHTVVETLLDHPWFDLPVTAESRQRRSLYQLEALRAQALEAAPAGDYLGFLRGSGMSLEVRTLAPADFERVYELSQRTNQLNFTGAKLGRDEVAAMAADPLLHCVTLRCSDRFGDYGLIGFAALDLAAGRLIQFFMSCRVQRKRVEHAAFRYLADRLIERGHHQFAVAFRPTERNGASTALLADLGFIAGAEGWNRPIAPPFADSDVVRLSFAAAPAEAAA
jgi:FkbH-like protein